MELRLRDNVGTGVVGYHSRDCFFVRCHLPVCDGNVQFLDGAAALPQLGRIA